MKQAEKEKIATKLGKALKPLTDAQKDYMNRHALHHNIYYTKYSCTCSHCGNVFTLGLVNAKATCPRCGLKSDTVKSSKKRYDDFGYACVMQTRGSWQILRYFLVESHTHADGWNPKGKYAIPYDNTYCHTEVLRKWINPTKGVITERVPMKMFPNYQRKPYSDHGSLKVLSAHSEDSDWSSEWFYKVVCPNAKILPYYKQRGVSAKNVTDLWIDTYMANVDTTPMAETFLKGGETTLANLLVVGNYDMRRNFQQVKIAFRHGFRFSSLHTMRDYWDYLHDLQELGMDTTNPKFLAPADFLGEHQRIHEKVMHKREIKAERRRREREIEEALRAEKCKIAFEFRKKVYGNLVITGFGITIKPLLTADEYKAEGEAMHHCVGGYVASHPDALILSARIKGKRVETIEVDMKKWVIIQSRAVCNGTSEHHSEILDLVNWKMNTLRRMARLAS